MKKKKNIMIISAVALLFVVGFMFLTKKTFTSNLKNFSETEVKWIQTLSKQD